MGAPRQTIGWTLCSGIGAPEMAAPWVDWRLAAEIEPFPRAVLEQRFGYKSPTSHNQGDPLLWSDMTEVTPSLARDHGVPLPNLLVAGTPCQAFSIAGLRKGTADARGNLTLKFVETCHAIVDARPDGKLTALWENVPGVLSDKGNAFGCFLAGLVGADDAIPSPDNGTWPGVGMVSGPRARAAWRVLDAQYFGVAQRRRRVFVVVDFGGSCDPAKILFERQGLHGNTPPRREAREGIAASLTASSGGCSGKDKPEGRVISARMTAIGEYADDDTASSLKARDYKDATDLVVSFDCKGTDVQFDESGGETPLRSMGHDSSHQNAGGHSAICVTGEKTHALTAEGHDAGEDGTGRATPTIAIQERSSSENPSAGPQGAGFRSDDTAYTLEARQNVQAVAFAQNQRDEVRITDIVGAISAQPGMKQQSFLAQPYSIMPQNSGKDFKARPVDVSQPLMAGGPVSGNQGGDVIATTWTVRRLTPVECARLQGFPDHHTEITFRGKPAADGPQYKAYGNSMAVPCVGWILDRIRMELEPA